MTNEDREALIDWCTEGGMSPERTEVVVRCIEWMDKVIDFHTTPTGELAFEDSESSLEEARFILDCINLYISI